MKCERKHVESSTFVHSLKHAFEILPNGTFDYRRKTQAKTDDKLAQIDHDFVRSVRARESHLHYKNTHSYHLHSLSIKRTRAIRTQVLALQLSEIDRGKNMSSSGAKTTRRPPRPPAMTATTVMIPPNVRWQYMDASGRYHNYAGADARTLEVAHVLKEKKCELRNRFGHYSIKFKSTTQITQMNLKTKRIRNVRRHVLNELTPQQQQKVNQLMSFLGGDSSEAKCRDILIESKWDLQIAINKFFG